MPKKKSYLTATDQFCGAGGSSIGATKAGIEVQIALNHWDKAIETHNTNFPNTYHECTDVSAVDPRRYTSTDILITSPECTNHSLAKGRKQVNQLDLFNANKPNPANERSRATMFDVPRFAEFHNYNLIIVENVVDVRKWRLWDAWIHAMKLLDYDHQCVYFNSMFAHPTPQSRDRIYVVFWKKNNPKPNLDIRPNAFCPKCNTDIKAVQSWKNPHKQYGKWGRYKSQYVYRCKNCAGQVTPYYYCSFNAVDWSIKTPRIKDRKKPLKPRTLERIQKGLDKYRGHYLIIPLAYTHGHANRAKPMIAPLPTQTARQDMGIAMPFITSVNKTTDRYRAATDAIFTQMPQEINSLVTPEPFLINYYGNNWGYQSMDDPVATQTGKQRHAIVQIKKPDKWPTIDDCGFRMLKPHEIGRAMAFPDEYTVLGTQREKVRQYGQAVTPPVMDDLIKRGLETFS
jgi:DNA (cytosine-5)-methyltransferase 1